MIKNKNAKIRPFLITPFYQLEIFVCVSVYGPLKKSLFLFQTFDIFPIFLKFSDQKF